jgi:hypothetical protein
MGEKYEEMFSILSHERNANQNITEIPSVPNQKGYHQENKYQCWEGCGGKKELLFNVCRNVN